VNIFLQNPPPSFWSIFFISLNVGFIFLAFINLMFLRLFRSLWNLQDSHFATAKIVNRLISVIEKLTF
jgi:hypothetical protein